MRSNIVKDLAIKWKNEGKSYGEIANLLNVSRSSAQNLCRYTKCSVAKKRGAKFKLGKVEKLRLKRTISSLNNIGQKVTANKLRSLCSLDVSLSTTQRHLKRQGYLYKKITTQIEFSLQNLPMIKW